VVEGKDGVILTLAQEGASIGWCNPQRSNLGVDVLRAGKRCESLCGDLLTVDLRKCTLGKMETLSHRRVMESPTCGKSCATSVECKL
jgi:hypothetical protein